MFKRFVKLLNRKNNQKGFTLVELMVVVVIIGVLAAIAVPVYNGATDKATIAAVQANARTVNGAIQVYLSVNSSYPASTDAAALITLLTGNTLGGPYLKSAISLPTGATQAYDSATGTYSITYKTIVYK